MRTRRAITEVAPLAFEVALHYSSALARGGFATVLRHDQAAGVGVEELSGAGVPPTARRALERIGAGRYTVVQSRLHAATMECRAPSGHEHIESFAILDAAVGGEAWFVACRLAWPLESFANTACAFAHDQVVIVLDQEDTRVRVVRMRFDDPQGVVRRKLLREALLRDLVLRPAFSTENGSRPCSPPLPQSGE